LRTASSILRNRDRLPHYSMSKSVVSIHQPSMTEWFAEIGDVAASEVFRKEDNGRAERMEVLYQAIGLPYERPEPLPARELFDRSPRFAQMLAERGDKFCAIRLVPTDPTLPKLRNRGLPLRECYETWLLQQEINPDDYTAYICPHSDTLLWSTIFVVTPTLVFGEVVRGLHSQLTQGETTEQVIRFQFDYANWTFSEDDAEAAVIVQRGLEHLRVSESARASLASQLEVEIYHGYLGGYFETTVWPDDKLYFIDYNRVLPQYIPVPAILHAGDSSGGLTGSIAYPGMVQGVVVIVTEDNLATVDFPDGAILVTDNTDVRFLPVMRRSGAIVTDRGGTLSHAAIVARELKKPCIVGTKTATTVLKTGDVVEVHATAGVVRIIQPTEKSLK
jgi:phosphohistidine swiveling domain-containing protein